MPQGAGQGRGRGAGQGGGRGQGGGTYDIHDAEAFELRLLSELKFRLDSETAADLNAAENAIWDLNSQRFSLDERVVADTMLNIEALASVRMDGRPPSARDIFFERADAAVHNAEPEEYVTRYERDRSSLEYALSCADAGFSAQTLGAIHERVLPPKHMETGGQLRDELKQVGGSRYHTFGSAYLMPRPEAIPSLLEDLVSFMELDDILVVEQAGIAHAQLINIHPFERGNGKMARAVIHMTLRSRGIATRYLLPFTPVIVTSSHDYVAGINACAFEAGTPEEDVTRNMNAWLSYFSNCCLKAANISAGFIRACEGVVADGEAQLAVRRDSAAFKLLCALPALPVFTAQMAADYLGCSFKRASEGCKQLLDAELVEQVSPGKRNRIYRCPEALDAYMAIDALR